MRLILACRLLRGECFVESEVAAIKIETIAVTNLGGFQGVVFVQDLVIEILKDNIGEADITP